MPLATISMQSALLCNMMKRDDSQNKALLLFLLLLFLFLFLLLLLLLLLIGIHKGFFCDNTSFMNASI